MAYINLEEMIQPLADNKSGDNLEYNPLYLEMENLAAGVPESVMGDAVLEGREPDWRKLCSNCQDLWKNTRDLRVAVYLTLSLSQLDGLNGFSDGIKLVNFLVSDMWECFYPQLDADDDNDPTERLNILQIISPSVTSGNDAFTFLRTFRQIKLFNNKKWTLRDLLIYQGEISTEESFDTALFNAETVSVPKETVDEKISIINEISALLDKINNEIEQKTNNEYSFSFECLKKELSTLLKFYSKLSVTDEYETQETAAEVETVESTSQNNKTGSFMNIENYKPRNRNEALLLVKKSADYFREVEPTNPVPYLLDRVLRIAEMNFIDILKDIDPGAVDRIKEQLGLPRD